jgi:hypothetical protein
VSHTDAGLHSPVGQRHLDAPRLASDEHAAFMDELVGDSFVILGGPAGDSEQTLHVVETTDENEVRGLAACPKSGRTSGLLLRWTLAEMMRVWPPLY